MTQWLLDHEPTVRLAMFAGVFFAMALWEVLGARRQLRTSKAKRWLTNLALVAVNTAVLRLLFPAAALGVTVFAKDRSWGLLNHIDLPEPLAVLVALVVLDLAIYLQHVMFHAVPILWRLHMVHHADPDFDVTTGSRFHPLEIVLSMGIKLAVIAALGPEPIAVLLFEVILNATAMFNHGNVRLPLPLDRALRWLLVTPDMHRVHHSPCPAETNTNFGFNLPWWDRFFGTYRSQPTAGHEQMEIGIEHVETALGHRLHAMLALPFLRRGGRYPITDNPPAAPDPT